MGIRKERTDGEIIAEALVLPAGVQTEENDR